MFSLRITEYIFLKKRSLADNIKNEVRCDLRIKYVFAAYIDSTVVPAVFGIWTKNAVLSVLRQGISMLRAVVCGRNRKYLIKLCK